MKAESPDQGPGLTTATTTKATVPGNADRLRGRSKTVRREVLESQAVAVCSWCHEYVHGPIISIWATAHAEANHGHKVIAVRSLTTTYVVPR